LEAGEFRLWAGGGQPGFQPANGLEGMFSITG